MPLTPSGEYLYFLVLTLLYGSPIFAAVLYFAWRQQRLSAAVKGVILVVPVAALALQLLFRGGAVVGSIGLEREAQAIGAYLGDAARADVIGGSYVGSESRHGRDFRRYQFPSLDGNRAYVLDILLPPDHAGMQALIRLSDEIAPGLADARLLVWPERITTNPAVDPGAFFREYSLDERPEAFGPHTLVVGLRPRESIVVHPSGVDGKWRWTTAELELTRP